MSNILAAVLRWIFGLFYVAVGTVAFGSRLLGKPFVTPINNEQEHAFAMALSASGFMEPLISAACLVGGLMVLFRRTTPLGLAVLAPLIAVIFLYHFVLSGSWLIGAVQLALLCVLAWLHRSAYHALWNYSSGASATRRDPG